MFFSPLLVQYGGPEMKVLCLTGNTPRQNELYNSLSNYQIKKENIKVFDFTDSMHKSLLEEALGNETLRKQMMTIKKSGYQFVTFDESGISGHQNHKDCYEFLRDCLYDGKMDTIKFYKINSVNFAVKYLIPGLCFTRSEITLYSSFQNWKKTLAVMRKCHVSQMVWYRYLWFFWSR